MDTNGHENGISLIIPEHIARLWDSRSRDILKLGHPTLRTVARPVGRPTPATRKLVERMKIALLEENGLGLAAPQVGVGERVIIYRLPEENAPLRIIVDPRITSAKGEQTAEEGCLSLPYLHGEVTRAREIIVKGTDMLGRSFRRRASDLEARVIQHEIDHLDGILFVDRANPDTLHWALPEATLTEPDATGVA